MRLRVILSLFVICSVGIAPSIAQSKLVEVASNNIRAKIFNTGVLFNDVASGQPAFEVPIGSNTHAFFSAALTMGGLDHNSSLRMASGYAANSDYSVGPLTIGTATNSDSVRMYYNRIWEVNKNQINLHRANYSDPTYTIPVDILEWPAHDTVWAGYDFDLAPFVDVDQNGLYEPQKGDYPEIQGDFAFYFINNDATQHILTNTLAIGAEVHCMVYGFANNTTLNETLFADYRVINRSNIDYTNFYVGLYADTDLGNHMDDYLEADVDRGMIFAKNGDAFDDPVLGYSGYGDHPGAAGILVLRGPEMDANGQDDSCYISPLYTPNSWGFQDGIADNEQLGLTYFMPLNYSNGNNGTPDLAIHYYNYMRGAWKNGRALTFGGDGFSSSVTNCRIAYFKDTDPTFYGSFGNTSVTNDWTEDGNNPPGDRLAILSSGPFTFEAGEELHLTYAFLFARDSSLQGVAASVDTLKRGADFVREFYSSLNGQYNCFNPLSLDEQSVQELQISPIPANDYLKIENAPVNSYFQIFSINGKLIKEGSLPEGTEYLDVSSLKNGIYLIRLQSKEGIARSKVIISR